MRALKESKPEFKNWHFEITQFVDLIQNQLASLSKIPSTKNEESNDVSKGTDGFYNAVENEAENAESADRLKQLKKQLAKQLSETGRIEIDSVH